MYKEENMRKILWIILVVGLVFTLAGCEWLGALLAAMAAPQGYVLNAKTGAGISDVSMTMTYLDTPAEGEEAPGPFIAVSGTDGYYTFLDVAYGTYELTASKSGYVFVKQVVSVSGLAQYLPDMIGFEYDESTDALNISLILMWDADFNDVDAHLTYPNGDPTPDDLVALPFTDVYDETIALDWNYLGAVTDGFFPEYSNGLVDSTQEGDADYDDYRVEIYYGNPDSLYEVDLTPDDTTDDVAVPAVSLDVDDTDGQGPETITIAGIPFEDWLEDSSTQGGAYTGLPEVTGDSCYAWVGVMEYYINAYESGKADSAGDYLSQVDTGESADAVLYVMQGNTLMGIYTVPTYTNIETASVVKINMFWEYDAEADVWYEFFQIAPDLRILQDTALIKGTETGVINIRGRAR
jgi:hypothetical protein